MLLIQLVDMISLINFTLLKFLMYIYTYILFYLRCPWWSMQLFEIKKEIYWSKTNNSGVRQDWISIFHFHVNSPPSTLFVATRSSYIRYALIANFAVKAHALHSAAVLLCSNTRVDYAMETSRLIINVMG